MFSSGPEVGESPVDLIGPAAPGERAVVVASAAGPKEKSSQVAMITLLLLSVTLLQEER